MIYADANASFPVAARHYDQVAARLKAVDGNPSSIHAKGRDAKVALEAARASVAKLLGARGPEVIFTSGATEANNFALQGAVARARASSADDSPQALPELVASAGEHSSVIEAAKILEGRGLCTLRIAPVRRTGAVDEEALLALVGPRTTLVALIYGNNEVGTVNDVPALAARIKAKNAATHVHADAVQMLGKFDLSHLAKSAIDSAAFSAHKIGAFKGVGALYLKSGVKLAVLIAGGGQERGRRPGTENMPGVVSFGLRADEVASEIAATAQAMRRVRDLWLKALSEIPGAVVHGDPTAATSLPNTVNFHVAGVPGDDILLNFDLAGILASSGSACSSGVARPSHVLTAMGYDEWTALNSVRVSFTGAETEADLAHMLRILTDVTRRAQKIE